MTDFLNEQQRMAAARTYAAMTTVELNDLASEKQELLAYLISQKQEAEGRYGDHSSEAMALRTQAHNQRTLLGLMREEQRRREYPRWDASVAEYERRQAERDRYDKGE